MIPKPSDDCGGCRKEKTIPGFKCSCICHTTDYIQGDHVNVWEIPMKKHGGFWFHWYFKLASKIKGEKYEIF